MGKNIDGYLTDDEHDAVDHTAAPFNLIDNAAHAALDHAGVTGVGVDIQINGAAAEGPRGTLNLIPSGGAGLAAVDDPGNNRVNVTITAPAAVPTPGLTRVGSFQSGTTGTSWGSISVATGDSEDLLAIITVRPSNLTGAANLMLRFGGQTTGYTNSASGATTYVDLGTVAAGTGAVVRVQMRSVFYFTDVSMSAGNRVKTFDVRRFNTDNTEYLNRAIGTAVPSGAFGSIDLLTTASFEGVILWDLYQYATTNI